MFRLRKKKTSVFIKEEKYDVRKWMTEVVTSRCHGGKICG